MQADPEDESPGFHVRAPDGRRLWVVDEGDGEPVLLIAGLGLALRAWRSEAEQLARRFRVIRLDNRGAGRSDAPWGRYTTRGLAADALAVLDALAVRRAHVYGMSLGAMIAQEVALARPGRVATLTLGAGSAGGRHLVPPRWELVRSLLPNLVRGHHLTSAGRARMVTATAFSSSYQARLSEEALQHDHDLVIRAATRVSPGLLAQLAALLGHRAGSRLPGLRVPTLVLHGADDRFLPPANGERLARLIPGAQLALLPGAAHAYVIEAADDARERFVRFVEAHPVAP
jgi:pimeloyl-ACP methyl ester carboxylesterase